MFSISIFFFWGFLYFIGAPIKYALQKNINKNDDIKNPVLNTVLIGYAALAILVTYGVYFSITIQTIAECIKIIAAIGIILKLLIEVQRSRGMGIHKYLYEIRTYISNCAPLAIAIVIALLTYYVTIKGGWPGTPWRVGPDAAGYATTAKYLIDGNIISGFTGQFIFPYEIYAYEFLVQGNRLGTPGLFAFFAEINSQQPIEIEFVLVCVAMILIQTIIYSLARTVGNSAAISGLISVAAILNCNFLFIIFEGGYAQILAMPLIILIIYRCLSLLTEGSRQSALFVALLLAASIVIYLESLIILLVILSISVPIILIIKKNDYLISVGRVLFLIVIAMVISYPISSIWIRFQIENSGLISLAGWAQPTWANSAQILGLSNIYNGLIGNKPNYTLKVGIVDDIILWGSLLIVALYTYVNFLKNKNAVNLVSFVISFVILIALIYFKVVKNLHSYSYMKIYTIIGPIYFLTLLMTFKERLSKEIGNIIVISICVGVSLNGLSFIRDYIKSHRIADYKMAELSNIRLPDRGLVYFKLKEDEFSHIRNTFIYSAISTPVIHNLYYPQQDLIKYASSPVYQLTDQVNKEAEACPANLVWSNGVYRLYKTNKALVDGIVDIKNFNWGKISLPVPRPELEVRWNGANGSLLENQKINFELYDHFDPCK